MIRDSDHTEVVIFLSNSKYCRLEEDKASSRKWRVARRSGSAVGVPAVCAMIAESV